MNLDNKLQELRVLWKKADRKDRKIIEGRARLLQYAMEAEKTNKDYVTEVKTALFGLND
jgi:hypothetical protein